MTTDQETALESEDIHALLHGGDVKAAVEQLAAMHPADQADLYQRLDEDDRQIVVSLLTAEGLAHLIEHLDEELIPSVVEPMPRAALARVLDLTDNDVAADVLRLLPPADMARTLTNMATAADITTREKMPYQ